jgi:vacuolar-type H+-ATPase subunit F/Vma7
VRATASGYRKAGIKQTHKAEGQSKEAMIVYHVGHQAIQIIVCKRLCAD